MARFANDCLQALAPLLQKLERELGTSVQGHRADSPIPSHNLTQRLVPQCSGPDTTDLCLRVGLNSGPVTVRESL
jgi:hypothetical protein